MSYHIKGFQQILQRWKWPWTMQCQWSPIVPWSQWLLQARHSWFSWKSKTRVVQWYGHLDLKKRLCKAPVLAMPDFKEFILDTDAGNLSIGAVLSQKINDEERPVAYTSQTLTKAEHQYCVTRKELLVVVYFAKYSKHYLYGKQFTVRTNHSSSCWLLSFKNPEGQLARWL